MPRKDIDLDFESQPLAQFRALFGGGDKEIARPFMGQREARGANAQTIGICLDDSRAGRA